MQNVEWDTKQHNICSQERPEIQRENKNNMNKNITK